ncbi:MAG: lipid-binding SYLF domain-containing protein [Woeseiaceae bacterium]|nr:lipid-binding SYLF domain-containing protein [Woeseiaceae bacterium]
MSTTAIADWEPDSGDRLQERAAKAVTRIKAKVERSQPFFDDAYAVAVWPGITRLAVGFGGAYGKGVVIEQDEAVGTVTYWQGSSGIQAGVKNFTLIIFFKDKESLDGLKRGDFQFTGQAGVDLVTFGASATPAYNQGVAIIALTNLGLMAEFSAAGTFFRFKRYDQ